MIVVFLRSIVLYIAVLISMRIMGKGEIAEMNCFDLVITLLIAEVASLPMENNDIPMINGIAALTGLVAMQTIISFLSLKFRRISIILSGKPSILVNKGEVDYKELKRERVSINELLEQLRIQGYFNIKYIQYAILEADGSLSVVPTPNYNSTPSKEYKHLPIPLILDGSVIKENLRELNKDELWLNNILKMHKIKRTKDVLLCILDEYDGVVIQKKK
ncbi:DUF421 domain-containing protein [Intestinibacter sp.]|uniref:DUF421 domain-containing protein n=1 Tax=Intestinibacter sp. TaxID=1965304 RepID=UPI002A91680B|nr:DUF421 domain-containing protein [Intestinibacter sp.]MDY5211009.1 DUF421 domain-containing protein [Intestinibacter sp.]